MGGAGFVGSASAGKLRALGVNTVALTRREVDLLTDDASVSLRSYLTPSTTLVVTSALAPVKNSLMLLENLRMIQAVLEALKARPVSHVVYISSDAVYADSDQPLTESSITAPGSLHGVMHLAREIAFQSEVAHIPQVFIRPTLIFGAEDPHNGYGPNRFLRLARDGREITLFGEGEEKRDHIFIEDVAEIVGRVVMHRATGIINAATGTVTSFREIAEMAAAQFEPRVRVTGTHRVGAMPHNGYRPFDVALLERVFPGTHRTTLQDGLSRMKAFCK
jgi:nucleoside-diphosphate-sugar epimerase